jgi:hypothetical protein
MLVSIAFYLALLMDEQHDDTMTTTFNNICGPLLLLRQTERYKWSNCGGAPRSRERDSVARHLATSLLAIGDANAFATRRRSFSTTIAHY